MGFSDDELEIAVYGLKRVGMFIGSLIVAAVIGCLTKETSGIFLFLLLFIPLRIFAGGLHLPSLVSCGVLSSGLLLMVAIILKSFGMSFTPGKTLSACALMSFIIIAFLAPVSTGNKVLFEKEKRRFKTISVIISSIELGLFFIAKTCTKLQLLILIVLVTESLFLLIQTCINTVQKKHNDAQQKLLKGAS